jgi:hypothetical protein
VWENLLSTDDECSLWPQQTGCVESSDEQARNQHPTERISACDALSPANEGDRTTSVLTCVDSDCKPSHSGLLVLSTNTCLDAQDEGSNGVEIRYTRPR